MPVSGLFGSFDISASALRAQRHRMIVVANNLSNIHTTHGPDGSKMPYRRKQVLFRQGAPGVTGSDELGVSFAGVLEDASPFRRVYRPGHPDAITAEEVAVRPDLGPEDVGYVLLPNVEMPVEMVDMMEASRTYEANVTMMNISKGIIQSLLEVMA